MKCISTADRKAAALRAKRARAGRITPHAVPGGVPNFFGPESNYANSPIIPKFVESLPGLTSANKSTSGAFIPIAVPDQSAYPGSDYYQIQLGAYAQKMLGGSMPATTLRGYQDIGPNTPPSEQGGHYLGPMIIARKDRPVRLLFKNNLPADANGGKLPLPVDKSLMGATPEFSENRAVLHLHGGNNLWISDGTPQQWIVPAGETNVNRKGTGARNVPDMPVPPDGSQTYIWPNNQSGRLIWYHDHALGLTRLNVYAGEAAGYLVVDQTEDDMIAAGAVPNQGGGVYNYGIPLILQDKTFVDPTNVAKEDPTWPFTPVLGDLWYPHVYVPNQNPADPEGVNAVGRWDYGPWFWPPQDPTSLLGKPFPCVGNSGLNYPDLVCPGIPNPSTTPEAYGDTPLVNGQAYPYVTVEPKAYRFRVLNAANDRAMNLQLYFATTGAGTPGTAGGAICNAGQSGSACTEVKMVIAAPPTGSPALCSLANPMSPSGLVTANMNPDGSILNSTGLPSGCWPTTWPTDGRDGGVPDPATAGPAMIQIGTESGLLPSPVIIPSTPVSYDYNRKSITVLNILNHGLLLGPAERADIIVDFSSVPSGSTLILYNDSPAAVPAFDPRIDYYTGNPDQSETGDAVGGAPSTQPGFGPNTRTIMQFRVQGSPAAPFSVPNLTTALASAYATSQPKPVIPELAHNAAFPGIATKNNYARIQDNTMSFKPPVTPAPPYDGATCTSSVAGQVCASMAPKTIQELFTLDYGRMNATLGVELPFTRFNVQTTVPYGYIDPPTEFVTEGRPALWKITHNGVDTHFIHFHLFDVQVINRVGWDGQIKAPDPNEIGWKDTVRMNPLEDIVVALQPTAARAPFVMPFSSRLYDPTMPMGATTPLDAGGNPTGAPYFTNVDPTNAPTTTVNSLTNYGSEFAWHCHILGHEENDMMRPIVFTPKAAIITPTPGTAFSRTTTASFTWNANPAASHTFGRVTTNYGVSSSYMDVGKTLGGHEIATHAGSGNSASVTGLPSDGSNIYVRLYSVVDGVTLSNDYTYVASTPVAAAMVSPTAGSTLTSNSQLFQWDSGFGLTGTYLNVGTTPGGSQILGGVVASGSHTATVTGLPVNGSTVYVTLYSVTTAGTTISNAYTYTAATAVPAAMISPTNGSTFNTSSVTFTWSAGSLLSGTYIWVGSTLGGSNFLATTSNAATSATATVPATHSVVYVRLFSVAGGNTTSVDYTYTSATAVPSAMSTPVPGSTLTSNTAVFNWTAGVGVSFNTIWVGTSVGTSNLLVRQLGAGVTTATANNLPTDGSTIYVRLFSRINGVDQLADYTYVAASQTKSIMSSPAQGSTLGGSSVTFTWSSGAGVSFNTIWIGSSVGTSNILARQLGAGVTTTTATNIPTDGTTVYVRLFSRIAGVDQFNDYSYTAQNLGLVKSTMSSPTNGSTLTATSATFTWTAGSGVTFNTLWVGTTLGGSNIRASVLAAGVTSLTVSGLPTNGGTIYVRLFSRLNGVDQYNDYTYTALAISTMTSPTAGSRLPGTSTTFTWSAGAGTVNTLWVGTSVGSSNIRASVLGAGVTTLTVSGLPTTGATIYVRLFSRVNGVDLFNDYTYTAVTASAMSTPTPSSTLAGTSVAFTWTAGSGVTGNTVWVGTSVGASNVVARALAGGTTTTTVTNIPRGGVTIYVRLFSSYSGGSSSFVDYTYTAAP